MVIWLTPINCPRGLWMSPELYWVTFGLNGFVQCVKSCYCYSLQQYLNTYRVTSTTQLNVLVYMLNTLNKYSDKRFILGPFLNFDSLWLFLTVYVVKFFCTTLNYWLFCYIYNSFNFLIIIIAIWKNVAGSKNANS